MSEIEKMYENAGVELTEGLEWVCQNPDHCVYQNLSVTPENCIGCEHFEREMKSPPFTAEKQIELIKFLYIKYKKYEMFKVSNRDEVGIRTSENTFYAYGIDIQNAIANFFNRNWQDLTEEEKQQVKGILE